jgi:predicted metal-dependent hydrolase
MTLEKGSVSFGKRNIDFFVRRSKRRTTVSIFVDPVEGIFLRAPSVPSLERLSRLVRSKATWILDKQRRINETLGYMPKREFVTGESLLYLGRQLRLKVLKRGAKSRVTVKDGRFAVSINRYVADLNREDAVKGALCCWYKKRARIVLYKRTIIYAKNLGISIPEIILSNQDKRWGSCNRKGQIRFNWHIIMAPIPLVDYVVAHELCHLRYVNHSEDFWRLLGIIMPDYETRRERLRREGARYIF